jgi:hypothetical protein
MTQASEHQRKLAREARIVALVIAGAMVLWVGVQWLGARMGWDARFAILADLAAAAAFIWALVVTWRIWRRRNQGQGN